MIKVSSFIFPRHLMRLVWASLCTVNLIYTHSLSNQYLLTIWHVPGIYAVGRRSSCLQNIMMLVLTDLTLWGECFSNHHCVYMHSCKMKWTICRQGTWFCNSASPEIWSQQGEPGRFPWRRDSKRNVTGKQRGRDRQRCQSGERTCAKVLWR